MSQLGIIASLGFVVVLAFFYLRRALGGAGAAWWGWAWGTIWVAGLLTAFATRSPVAAALGAGIGNLFMFLTLAGALAFAGRRAPRWLAPLGLATSVARAVLALAGAASASFLLAMPVDAALGVRAAFVLARREAEGPARLLPWAFLVVTAVDLADLALRARGESSLSSVLAWTVAGVSLSLLQILSLVERARAGEARARLELAGERSVLRAVLDTAPVGVVLGGPDRRVRMVNRLAPLHWGFAGPEVMQGASTRALAREVAPRVENAEVFLAEGRRAEADPDAVIEDAELRLGPPGDRTIDLFSSPVVDEAGRRLGRVFVTRDVTAERRLEEELRQAQKMETLGTLAGGIAHDFNNQLTAILGNVRLAREAAPQDPEEAREALADLERAAQRCVSLTKGLLAFARRAPVHLHPLAAGPVVAEVARRLRAELPATVELSVELAPDLPPVRSDAPQLEQVLLHLASNARDAVGKAGHLRLRAHRCERTAAEGLPSHVAPGAFVELVVEDDGVGMDPWTLRRAFDPFFTTKPVGEGTGLGLAVVYGLVQAHGGRVEVESRPGCGSRFRVLLPVAEEGPAPAGRAARVAAPGPTGETVLLAEDDARVRRLARRSLEREGYRVVEARDGDEAVALFRRDPEAVDVVVCDLSMPGRSGAEALDAIRRLAPGLPAVLASGHFDEAAAGAPPGVVSLAKPYAPSALVERVRRALEAGRGGVTAAPPAPT